MNPPFELFSTLNFNYDQATTDPTTQATAEILIALFAFITIAFILNASLTPNYKVCTPCQAHLHSLL